MDQGEYLCATCSCFFDVPFCELPDDNDDCIFLCPHCGSEDWDYTEEY